jgi:UPF0271 protein
LNGDIYILDSTAFYSGFPFQGDGRYYTTYNVLDEVKHQNIASPLIHTRVQVIEPSRESVQRVKIAAKKTGDASSLSEADTSILATTLDMGSSKVNERIILVTDDFAVRNVAEVLGINLSETAVRGTWKRITWVTYCKGCGKEYRDSKATVCNVCGTLLSRKPLYQ